MQRCAVLFYLLNFWWVFSREEEKYMRCSLGTTVEVCSKTNDGFRLDLSAALELISVHQFVDFDARKSLPPVFFVFHIFNYRNI